MTEDAVLREELHAAMEARKELGADMEPAVVDASSRGSNDGSRTARQTVSAR